MATGLRYAGNYERKSVGISGKGHFIFYQSLNSFHFYLHFPFFDYNTIQKCQHEKHGKQQYIKSPNQLADFAFLVAKLIFDI